MRELMPEEKKYLVEYCMRPEYTELALAIGQIQPALEWEIIRKFLEELDKSVGKKLKECDLDLQWEQRKILKPGGPESPIYRMTMKGPRIDIELCYYLKSKKLYLGTPAKHESCPDAESLASYFEDMKEGMKIERSNESWRWWFYPEENHKRLENLSFLHSNEVVRCSKIDYFTDTLVLSANAISKALRG